MPTEIPNLTAHGFPQNPPQTSRLVRKIQLKNSKLPIPIGRPHTQISDSRKEELEEQWWTGNEEEINSGNGPLSVDYSFLTSFPPDEPEKDLLVVGRNSDLYLDIKDKDFFNVNSNDDIFARSSITQLEQTSLHGELEEIERWVNLEHQ